MFCSGSLGQILKQTFVSNFLTVILKPGHLTWIAFPKALFPASFKKNLKINHTVIYNNIRYYLLKNIFFNTWISGSGRDSEGNHSGQTSTSNLSKSTSLNSWFSSLTIQLGSPQECLEPLDPNICCEKQVINAIFTDISVDTQLTPIIYKYGLNWGNWIIFHLPHTLVEKESKISKEEWPKVNRCPFLLKLYCFIVPNHSSLGDGVAFEWCTFLVNMKTVKGRIKTNS